MNRRLFRIVFNQARGLMMVVAESVTSNHKAPGTTRGATTSPAHAHVAALKPIAFQCALALGLVTVIPPARAAGIIADPAAPQNQQPVVLQAGNGVPVVNIQTPSAGGISRNTYSQFDVNQNGVILNNARREVQTQQGGWIQGNDWLARGTARIILNEVTSNNPSQLRGYIEVAGDRAQVIVANPAGISCHGCGFINASQATLTTGTAQFDQNGLSGFLVSRGMVDIGGTGLDASQVDFTAIIARAVQVNAGIWAKSLQVSTGHHQTKLDGTVTTPTTGTGSKPQFAIDVGHLGGMYAGKIQLIGTEAGVGVRNAGQIGASAGEVVLSAEGLLTNSGLISSTTTQQINTASLDNTGTIYAKGDATIKIAHLNNQGLIGSQQNLQINATHTVTSHKGSTLAAGLNSDGQLNGGGEVRLGSGEAIAVHGQALAGQQISVHTGRLNLSEGELSANTLDFAARDMDTRKAIIVAADTLTMRADRLDNQGGSLGARLLDLHLTHLDNTSGKLLQTGT
ncbi:filamentous hemagglutinin N-terminal domain-containing protein, partial [Chitinimonas sp. BJB300]